MLVVQVESVRGFVKASEAYDGVLESMRVSKVCLHHSDTILPTSLLCFRLKGQAFDPVT